VRVFLVSEWNGRALLVVIGEDILRRSAAFASVSKKKVGENI
jgi:hypothetical protein